MYLCIVKRLGHLLKYIVSHKTLKIMPKEIFDICFLKSLSLRFWSDLLTHDSDSFSGNIYFVAGGCKYRVHFDCMPKCYFEAKFYHYGSRSSFNKRVASSFRELLDSVYELLNF